MPGLDADELRLAGLGPDQGVGELGDVTDNAAAGALLVDAQGGGLQVHHAVGVIGEEVLIDGDGIDVAAQLVDCALDQAGGLAGQADGGLGLGEAQLVVGEGVLVIEGNGESGVVADAEG